MYSADHSTVVDRVGFALYDTVSNGIYLQVAKTIIQAKAYRTGMYRYGIYGTTHCIYFYS